MRKNKLLTVYAVWYFAFLVIPLVIITISAFGGGSAITFPIESFSFKWFAMLFALKSFPPFLLYKPGGAFGSPYRCLWVSRQPMPGPLNVKGNRCLSPFSCRPPFVWES